MNTETETVKPITISVKDENFAISTNQSTPRVLITHEFFNDNFWINLTKLLELSREAYSLWESTKDENDLSACNYLEKARAALCINQSKTPTKHK